MLSDIYDIYAKAQEYYLQRQARINWITEDRVLFSGNHAEHVLERIDDLWTCDCETFKRWHSHPFYRNFCPHVIAVEKSIQSVAECLAPAYS